MSLTSPQRRILFVDVTHPKAYDEQTLTSQPLGGTEASVIRTAGILASRHQVCVAQKARSSMYQASQNLQYLPLEMALETFAADEVVVLRKFPTLKKLRQHYPGAGLHLWLHTYKNAEYALKKPLLQNLGAGIVANSRTHRRHLDQILNRSLAGKVLGLGRSPVPVSHCYNPVPVPALGTPVQRDINKLIFLSAPNKGLEQVLDAFAAARRKMPALRLYVANPGYRPDARVAARSGIVPLGALPHQAVMRHVAESLCVFYPQDSFAETFGLIYAEANALSVPVMACDVGAAREILHPANPLVAANDYAAQLDLLRQWQKQPPAVARRVEFSAAAVARQWHKVFDRDAPV